MFAIPSFLGGKNWMPMAYSPDTELFYIPSNEWGMDIWNEPVTYKKGAAYLGSGFTIKPIFDDYIGSLKAMDPVSGEIKWEYKNKAPLWSGVMTTAGGLVFFGTQRASSSPSTPWASAPRRSGAARPRCSPASSATPAR